MSSGERFMLVVVTVVAGVTLSALLMGILLHG